MNLHLVLKRKPTVGYGVLTLCDKIIFVGTEYTKGTVLPKDGPTICNDCNRLISLSKYKRLKKVFVAIEGEFPSDWVYPSCHSCGSKDLGEGKVPPEKVRSKQCISCFVRELLHEDIAIK